jgi:hypothetical protein
MDFCNFNERQQFGLSSMRQKIECKSKCHWQKKKKKKIKKKKKKKNLFFLFKKKTTPPLAQHPPPPGRPRGRGESFGAYVKRVMDNN